MNKKMVRMVVLVLILSMVIGTSTTVFASGNLSKDITNTLLDAGKDVINTVVKAISDIFKDIKESDWFASTVEKLVNLGGISGYPDGTFKPNNQITRAEFTKILVSAIGYTDLQPTTNHWASGYVDKAVAINLTSRTELSDLNGTITRKEMAKMVANSLDHLGEEQVSNRLEYRNQIRDYNSIKTQYQDSVLKAYTKGIITGYPDGTFGGDKGLTRAEASTVVIRVIDKSERKLPPEPTTTPITESGPNVDLSKVVVTSEAEVNVRGPKGDDNPYNVDFNVLFALTRSLEPQYEDAQNLLDARFGKNNSTVKEIMDYIKTKNVREKELKLKTWHINGQQINAQSNPNSQTIDLMVWRAK